MSALNPLILFNEKVDRLYQLSFTENIRTDPHGTRITFTRQDDESEACDVQSERYGPSLEGIEAFVLTFKQFIQERDPFSIPRMAIYYDQAEIPFDLKREFSNAKNRFNTYLDAPSRLQFDQEAWPLTHRTILNTFIYGGLAHSDLKKKAVLDRWMEEAPYRKVLFENELVDILVQALTFLTFFKALNDRVLGLENFR